MKANNRICIGHFFRKGKALKAPNAPKAPNALKGPNAPKASKAKKKPDSFESGFVKVAITYSPAFAVPSALQGLTSLFGMGRGGALLLSSPQYRKRV